MHNKYDDFSGPTSPSSPQPGGAPIPTVPAPATILVTTGGTEDFAETTLIKGPATSKIAVINLVGIIESRQSEEIRLLTEEALRSPDIRAIILRINSPGGTVSASDQIHYYITKLRQETGLPVLAFYASVAASEAIQRRSMRLHHGEQPRLPAPLV